MLLDLCTIKNHLNLDEDFIDDDAYILSLAEVAQTIVEKHIDCKFDDILGEDGEIPSPLLQAMLLMVGNLYMNREPVALVSTIEIPYTYKYLLSLYKNY